MVTRRSGWHGTLTTVLVALLGALVGLATLVAPATAAPSSGAAEHSSERAVTSKVRGQVMGPRGTSAPRVRVSWFTKDWTYLGSRKATAGGYSLTLRPGTYRLQFTDLRPTYDLDRFAPADVTVTVVAGRTTVKNVRMRPGAAIGGRVKAGGKPAAGARVVAANKDERSWETTADKKGNYALGGLPAGTYSIFTYDRRGRWVGKSTYIRKLATGAYKAVDVNLTKRAGSLIVDLYVGDSVFNGKAFPTAVSNATGQFWTAKAARGSVTFKGLYPGTYTIHVPALGNYFAATVKVKSKVRPGRASFGSVRLTKRGAWVTGAVVDGNDPSYPLPGAQVRLYNAGGDLVDTTTSNANGRFVLDGLIATQSGMRVVAGPAPTSPYLGQGTHYCKYGTGIVADIAVTTNRQREIGDVALPHLPDDQQDGVQCHTPSEEAPA